MNKNTTHKSIAVDGIEVVDRLRDDYGDVLGLAEDIKHNGLLHGIVVEEIGTNYRLLAGERRLRACQSLGWKEVQAKVYSGLTDEERLDIEVSENTKRKGLTEGELAKRLGRVARAEGSFAHVGKTSEKGGRPTQGRASRAKVAAKAGLSRQGLERAEKQARAIAQFPELNKLSQAAALKEYDKRTKPPKKKAAPAPIVENKPKSEDYRLAPDVLAMMDRLLKEKHYGTHKRVLEDAVVLLYSKEFETKPESTVSVSPTPSQAALTSGVFIHCDVCKKQMRRFDAKRGSKGTRGHSGCIKKAA